MTPPASTVERVAERIIHVDRAGKPAALVDVLRRDTIDRALVFTRTKHGADKVVRQLTNAGIAAQAIHGNKSQGQRERALAAFRAGEVKTLVATDIAARGIDVDGISHVVNFDLPNIPETYVHRIGRTARAGADGTAISLCDREELTFLRDIEKLIGKSIPSDNRPRANGGAAKDHREAAERPAHRRAAPHRRHEGTAAPARSAQEQAGDGPNGIAAVAFMRRGTGSRGAGMQAAPNWDAGRKKSRRGRGRPAAI